MPNDEKNPLPKHETEPAGRWLSTYGMPWLAHKEAKALIRFDAVPPGKQ